MSKASRALFALSMLAVTACAHPTTKVAASAFFPPPAVIPTEMAPKPDAFAALPQSITPSRGPSPIAELAFSPDGSRLAIARANWAVSIIDLQTSNHLVDLRAPGAVNRFVWSNDGGALAMETHNGVLVSGIALGHTSSRVYGNERTTRDPRRSMKIAPDLASVARLDERGSVEILSVATGATLRVLRTHADALLGFVPKKPLLALESTGSIDLVDCVETGEAHVRIAGGSGTVGEPLDGGRFVIMHGQYATRVANLVRGRSVLSTPSESTISIEHGNALVTFYRGSSGYMMPPSRVARVYDLESGAVGARLGRERFDHRGILLSHLVWEDEGHEVVGLEPMTGRGLQKIVLPEGAGLLDVPSPGGDRFLASKRDGTLLVLNLEGAVVARVDR